MFKLKFGEFFLMKKTQKKVLMPVFIRKIERKFFRQVFTQKKIIKFSSKFFWVVFMKIKSENN